MYQFICSLFLLITIPALAVRTLIIPPLQLEGVFGGRGGTTASPGAICRDAGMEGGAYAPAADSLVETAGFWVSLNLANIGKSETKVKVILKSESRLMAAHSPPSREGIANLPLVSNGGSAPESSPRADTSVLLTIPAGRSIVQLLSYQCSSAHCMICAKGAGQRGSICNQPGDLLVAGTDPQTQSTPAPGRVCLYPIGTLNLELEVQEDRGAVVGQILTKIGRGGGTGQVALVQGALPFFPLNAGRPF